MTDKICRDVAFRVSVSTQKPGPFQFWKGPGFFCVFQFVAVDVLRTIEYLHNRSIDIISLSGNQVAHRAFISIEQFIYPKFVARRAITQKLQIEMNPFRTKVSFFYSKKAIYLFHCIKKNLTSNIIFQCLYMKNPLWSILIKKSFFYQITTY